MIGRGDLGPTEFHQPVGESVQQFGRGMGLAVPALVLRGRESEIGAEVHHVADVIDDLGREALGGAVGHGQEDQIEPGHRRGIHRSVLEPGIGSGEGRVQRSD